ncbi:MAG: FAD-binding oxidoreductase [Thermoleophilaceae bacterium]|nr:FAD-binding oxidoreductase [Thermoleophilaceae bacterium]
MTDAGYEAIIIGAGVQGTSAAYHLAEAGIARILLLEELGAPGRGSSGRSGSMLMKSRENRTKIALSKYSYDWLLGFEKRFGEPLNFNRIGFLSLVPPDLVDRYKAEHELRLEMGVPSELVDPGAIRELSPAVETDGIEFGVLGPDDAVIDPDQLVRSYLTGAQRLGAEIHTGEVATGIEVHGGRVRSVFTSSSRVACDIVVNAAGGNAAAVASWVGVDLPIDNLRRSLFFVECLSPEVQIGPMVEEAGVEWYFRGLGGGRALVGMGLEADGSVSDEPDLAFWAEVQRVASRRVPAFRDARVVSGTSGVRPLTPDILPIVGPVPTVEGFFNTCGWGGEGIMHSPAGGRMLADSVLGLETPEIPWEACSIGRTGLAAIK